MKKTAVLLSLLAFLAIGAYAREEPSFYVLEKWVEPGDDCRPVYVVVLVKSGSDIKDYQDIVKYKRIILRPVLEQYNSIVKHTHYSAEVLAFLGVELPAEQEHDAGQSVAESPFGKQESAYKGSTKKALKARVESLRQEAISIVTAYGMVTGVDMTNLRENANQFIMKQKELIKEDLLTDEEMEDLDSETEFAHELRRITGIYLRGVVHEDNKEGEVKQFFQKLTGRNDIKIKEEKYFLARIILGLVGGMFIGLLIGMGIHSIAYANEAKILISYFALFGIAGVITMLILH